MSVAKNHTRTYVDLPEDQIQFLKQLAKEQHRSLSKQVSFMLSGVIEAEREKVSPTTEVGYT